MAKLKHPQLPASDLLLSVEIAVADIKNKK
jgi:hypothetical protein